MSSATKGERTLADLQNMLQIPIEVAAILTGKNVTQAVYTVFLAPAIPNFPIKIYKDIKNWSSGFVKVRSSIPAVPKVYDSMRIYFWENHSSMIPETAVAIMSPNWAT